MQHPEWSAFQQILYNIDVVALARSRLQRDLERLCAHPREYFNEDAPLGAAITAAVDAREAVDFPVGFKRLLALDFGRDDEESERKDLSERSRSGRSGQELLKRGMTTHNLLVKKGMHMPEEWQNAISSLVQSRCKKLDFGRMDIGDSGAGALALLLTHVPDALSDVIDLIMDSCQVSGIGVAALSDAIAQGALPLLDLLNLKGNQILDDGLTVLADVLGAGKLLTLRELCLENTGVGDAGVGKLADALVPSMTVSKLSELKELDLSDNRIGDNGCVSLATAFGQGALPLLLELDLGSNEIGDEGITKLAEALSSLAKLSVLTLDNNWVGDRGLSQIASCIQCSGALRSLNVLALDDNMITGHGVHAFAVAVMPQDALPQLETLDLDGNEIGADGIDCLAASIAAGGMPSLKILEVDDEDLDHPSLVAACSKRRVTVR